VQRPLRPVVHVYREGPRHRTNRSQEHQPQQRQNDQPVGDPGILAPPCDNAIKKLHGTNPMRQCLPVASSSRTVRQEANHSIISTALPVRACKYPVPANRWVDRGSRASMAARLIGTVIALTSGYTAGASSDISSLTSERDTRPENTRVNCVIPERSVRN